MIPQLVKQIGLAILFVSSLDTMALQAAQASGLPECRVKRINGVCRVVVNGKPLTGLAYCYQDTNNAEQAYASGIQLFTFGMSMGNEKEGMFDDKIVDDPLSYLASRMPNAYLLPRVEVGPPQWWLDKHKDQQCVLQSGKTVSVSYASEIWRKDVSEQLRRYVEHLAKSPYADRIIGITLCCGISGEWQGWGIYDRDYSDFSDVNTQAYRSWLAKSFSEKTIKSILGINVDARNAVVPRRPTPEIKDFNIFYTNPALPLYYQYNPHPVVDSIISFAKTVKEASGGRILVGVYYGYEIQFAALSHESQHLAAQKVAESPYIDMMYSPALYDNRGPGETSAFMSCTESILARGKLWFNESDNRSYLSGEYVGISRIPGVAQNLDELSAVLKREFGHTVSRGTGNWWFDVPSGSFNDPALMSLLGKMNSYRASIFTDPNVAPLKPEIAFLVDETTPQFMTLSEFGGRSFFDYFSKLPTLGAPFGIYFLTDAECLPNSVKLVVVVNAYRLDAKQMKTLARLGRPGRSVLWLYAPGLYEAQSGILGKEIPKRMQELTGIDLRVDNEARPILATSRLIGSNKPFGVGLVQPVIWCSDPNAITLAQYQDTHRCAVAIKRHKGWISAWSGVPNPAIPLLREIARKAGVHIYSNSGDTFYAGHGTITIHTNHAGRKKISLPGKYDVQEVLSDKPLKLQGASSIEIEMGDRETRVFYLQRKR